MKEKTEKQKEEIVKQAIEDLFKRDIIELCEAGRYKEAKILLSKMDEKTPKKTTLEDINNVITEWVNDSDDDYSISFHAGFIEFDKKGNTKDDLILGFGDKEIVKLQIEEYQDKLKKNRKKFIMW